jgi:hypothetical protein
MSPFYKAKKCINIQKTIILISDMYRYITALEHMFLVVGSAWIFCLFFAGRS